MTEIKSKYRGYCKTCHYTIWQGERINFDGKPHHLDCVKALEDPTPRILNPQYVNIMGKIDKDKFKKAVKKRKKVEHVRTGGRVRHWTG